MESWSVESGLQIYGIVNTWTRGLVWMCHVDRAIFGFADSGFVE